ncbi:hypothetical protein [Chryseobacterium sp. 2R14A]|uniref:hypothetical protein n=1 Tax=Chryseobacterium sp. 2R14A TaxID=3380353 RepID=UPI003CF59A7D
MLKLLLNLFIFLLSVIFSAVSGQLYQVFNRVDIEKYQGENFILEGKIFYNNDLSKNSHASLSVFFVNNRGKWMKEMIDNKNACDYYKKGDWSSYELKGKINNKTKEIAVGTTIAGNESFYLDDFKLFILQGDRKIEIPVMNGNFEEVSLMPWQSYSGGNVSAMSISGAKSFSGKKSLLVDKAQK